MSAANLTLEQLAALQALDTCSAANAIDSFHVRLRNEGYVDSSVRCFFPSLRTMVGYAVTLRVRSSAPPPTGQIYMDRTDWWDFVLTIPAPRVVVIEDVDSAPGTGAFLGEVHSNILKALGCIGAVTTGAVRDLPEVEGIPFHFFARSVAVSHAYAHIVEVGGDVSVGGLTVKSGDLLMGDQHGVLCIPDEIAADIPRAANQAAEKERALVQLCRSNDFTVQKLRAALQP